MVDLENYADFCYDQVGSYVLDYIQYFEALRPQIAKAGLNVSLPEYGSVIIFSSIIGFLSSFFILTTVFLLMMGIAGIFLGIALSLTTGLLTGVGFYLLPSIIIKQRASKIRDTLPFATMYMSTLAGTGTSLTELFEILSEAEEYGEIANEAERISRDINNFGMDVEQALERAANRTPSEDFKDLLWGINHAISSGGELRNFLTQRGDTLMEEYQRRVESFGEQLSLLVEMYITVVIVGSIVFTSMSVVMSSFTGMSGSRIVIMQVLSIFIGLPLISGMFILLVQGMSPGGIR